LSRACLRKMIIFIYKWRKKVLSSPLLSRFCYEVATGLYLLLNESRLFCFLAQDETGTPIEELLQVRKRLSF
jgi:hypothetical protein